MVELGIDTFGDVTHERAGQPLSHAQVVRNVVEEGVLADAVTAEPDGTLAVRADAVLWATGFRPSLCRLAPLGLREPGGGVRLDGVRAVRDPRVFLVGYGASSSTLGATRADREAARGALAALAEPGEPVPA